MAVYRALPERNIKEIHGKLVSGVREYMDR